MKSLAILLLLVCSLPLGAKDYVIENKFVVTLPDGATPGHRLPGAIGNIGYPKVHGSNFQFMSYWWLWVNPTTKISDIPHIWEARMKNIRPKVSDVREFQTDSKLNGTRFHTVLRSEDAPTKPDYHSEMLLLPDPKGKVVLFQMSGDPKVIESAFHSLRYK